MATSVLIPRSTRINLTSEEVNIIAHDAYVVISPTFSIQENPEVASETFMRRFFWRDLANLQVCMHTVLVAYYNNMPSQISLLFKDPIFSSYYSR